ncbi:MAG: [protein-PII] uridylyltransferase [Deltaproteobacteria bacterium]
MSKPADIIVETEDTSRDLKERLTRKEAELEEYHKNKAKRNRALSGSLLAKKRSDIVDKLIRQALAQQGLNNLKNVSVVALGGYGRNELCPYSDVDLMFLYKPRNKTQAKEATEKLLYLLWDLNLDVGHSLRTIDECMELSEDEDTTVLTSLLDGRYVFGDRELCEDLNTKIFSQLLPAISHKFIQSKVKENEQRLNRFGRSVYLLEPNVKEGEGGLRDIHYALWIAQAKFKVKTFSELLPKGILIEKEIRIFEKALNFLLLIRSELHYLAGRREDRLGFEFQKKVAEFLGFKDAELPAVERFMRIYYLRANELREQSRRLIDKCVTDHKSGIRSSKKIVLDNGFIIHGGVLSVSNVNIFKENPANLMRAFEYADKHQVRMSTYLLDLIRDNLSFTAMDEKLRRNPELNASFLRLLKKGKNVADTLFEMNRLRFLGNYIPEFGKIVCMVQHDAYHVYTVDVHSIFMVREIENLLNYKYDKDLPLLTKTAESLMNRHVLYLACLFHDMGKGEGKGHAEKGAAMIPRIARRMGLSKDEIEQLQFLVKNHLLMSHFSQRRDIHDHSLIVRFAKQVKNLETLSLLYLLTFADIKSVGPDVWTNWKGMLLKELFIRTARVLERGTYRKEDPLARQKRMTEEVVKMLDRKISRRNVRKILKTMPESYFSSFSPRKIAYHMGLVDKSKDGVGMDVLYHTDDEFDEFTFWGFDEPGIFSKLCGVIRATGLNVLGARITTRNDGRILDVFYVNKFGKSVKEGDEIWDKLGKNMRQVLIGKMDVEKIVAKRKLDKPIYGKAIPQYPARIMVDNESSDLATVVDVYTHDRSGLLYDITKTLRNLELSIEYAKISTKVDQVVDAFYVVDSSGKKITDPEKIEDIKNALMESIAAG